jgi:molybdopterin/thiamine biosynthesis adenylyltransferase
VDGFDALTVSGVGHVHCVEPDLVELSNRQILFVESDLGRPKVDAAVNRLRAHNSDVTVTGEQQRVPDGRGAQRLSVRAMMLRWMSAVPE